jgi:predicted TIM-barrel fold metal-dependent hydrolase
VLIVDAQVHIWSSGKPTNPNHRQVAVYSKDDVLKEMSEAGVDAAIIHPPASQPYPYRNIHGHLRRIYDAFGPERMFWGTDITRMPCSWRQCVTLFTEELPWLTARDKELIMGRAVCDWLGWKRG